MDETILKPRYAVRFESRKTLEKLLVEANQVAWKLTDADDYVAAEVWIILVMAYLMARGSRHRAAQRAWDRLPRAMKEEPW